MNNASLPGDGDGDGGKGREAVGGFFREGLEAPFVRLCLLRNCCLR